MNAGPHGILLIDKPAGWTSHDVVAKARRLCSQRKIGHTGTLDPMATGLLVLCLGDATRLVEYMTAHDKRYEGEIKLGVRTDTDDAEGRVVEERPVPAPDGAHLSEIERAFTGNLLQRPPAYSAVQVAGQRAYDAARKGKTLDLPPRPVTVHELALTPLDATTLRIEVRCGPGTYIRSLARDIGEELGCGAHLSRLRRLEVGGFRVEDAVTMDALGSAAGTGRLDELLWAPDEGMIATPAAILAPVSTTRFVQGRPIVVPEAAAADGPMRVYAEAGWFLGVGRFDAESALRAEKVLASAQTPAVMSPSDTKPA